MGSIQLDINNTHYEISENYEKSTLLFVLRDVLGLMGTKRGCGTGDCGACKVLLDGVAVNSCTLLVKKAIGKKIITIEGVSVKGNLHPLQQSFIDAGAVQCGFCTPGMIISAKALLDKNPSPSKDEICEAIDNNLCRCTGYVKIIDAIEKASITMKDGKEG